MGMTQSCWIRITPRLYGEADIHVCNKGIHRDYYANPKRLKSIVDWVRDNGEVAPWIENGKLILEVYL